MFTNNPLDRASARGSSWRKSSGEAMLSRAPPSSDWDAGVGAVVMVDVGRQSEAWDIEGGGGGGGVGFSISQEPLKGERRRRPKRTTARDRDVRVSLRPSEMDRAATGRSSQRSGAGSNKLSRLTRGSGILASADSSPPALRPGSGKGWSSLRKAHLERNLATVGQVEQEKYRREGRAAARAKTAVSSKLLGAFQHHIDADDDEDTAGEGQLLKYDNKELVKYGVFVSCVGTTFSVSLTRSGLLIRLVAFRFRSFS